MASSVMEGHIKKLRKAEYLSSDIAHWLPDKGQLIPTPRPHERVVFLPHFLRGLGFPIPHFGLWLKTFNVKPKVVKGTQAECGGAMVSKLPNVTWPKGTFVETVMEWQIPWFYITEPRDPKWAAAPEFRSGIPTWLTSWKESGLT